MDLSEIDSNTPILQLLVQRYCTRMRQIRARRKLTQKYIMHKYLQYQQASQSLIQLYSLKFLELSPLPTSDENFPLPFKIEKTLKRSKPEIRSDHWWKNVYPRLTDDEFYKIFHVHREFFKELCLKMKSKLQLTPIPIPNVSHESTPVEKQIACSLYKLANGTSYRSTSSIFGLHRSTIHKLFYKFLRQLNELYSTELDDLTEDECRKMNEDLMREVNVPNAIGVLVRITFGTMSIYRIPNTLGIIDINGKFHFVCLHENTEDRKFYTELDTLCKKHHPDNPTNPEERYLVVTDQIVPKIDCFLNKKEIQFDNGTYDDELLKNLNTVLKCEEDAVRKLAERWNTLACKLEFSTNFLPLVIKSCIILHNLCEEFLMREGIEYVPIDTSYHIEFRGNNVCSEDENNCNDDDDDGVDQEDNDDANEDNHYGMDTDEESDVESMRGTIEVYDVGEYSTSGYEEYLNGEYDNEDNTNDNNLPDIKQEIIGE